MLIQATHLENWKSM